MVTIGASGHRELIHLEAITIAVDEALHTILNAYGDDTLQVISPLAEGADRLVARYAIEKFSGKLIVPLPLEKSDYMSDFESALSKAEFNNLLEKADHVIKLPAEDTREDCYLAAGMYIIEHSDVLIALWDGAPSRGIGGTGDIMAEARRRDIPIAWVQVQRSIQELTSDSKKTIGELDVIYEHFPIQTRDEVSGL